MSNIKNGNIFILWYQGRKQMPELVRMCFNSVLKNANGHRVVLLDNTNLFDWIEPFPEVVQQKFNNEIFSKQIESDLIRLSLLKKYGGLWLDATVFVSDIILDKLFEAPFFTVVRKEARKSDISGEISPFVLGRKKDDKSSQRLFDFSQELLIDYIKSEDDLMDYLLIENILKIGINSDDNLNKIVNTFFNNKKNILGLEKLLNQDYDAKVLCSSLKENLFSKLNFHANHVREGNCRQLTNYGKLCQLLELRMPFEKS